MNITDVSTAIQAKIAALITAKTISEDFTIQDNMIDQTNPPVVIVVPELTPLGYTSGGVAFQGEFHFTIAVIDKIGNHSESFSTTRDFVVEALMVILQDMDCQPSQGIVHSDGLWTSRGYKACKAECKLQFYEENI